jgi:AcrR family transcriptional regulator
MIDKSNVRANLRRMSKGEQTKSVIVAQSLDLASVVGLNGLSIGALAEHTGMSKSGLFAHFGSKEALQLAVLEAAEERFIDMVVRPASQAPRGIARIREIFERGFAWEKIWAGKGGCVFNASAPEFDDQPGPVRDRLVRAQRDWRETLLRVARGAVQTGEFRADLDCEQFAYELKAINLGYIHSSRLMRDPKAEAHARAAFERLVDTSRAKH